MIVDGTERTLLTREDIAKITNVSISTLNKWQFWNRPQVLILELKNGRKHLYRTQIVNEVEKVLEEMFG